MNLFSALELGKNSIMAQQQVFQVIGHNMANVNTPGYSRQVVDLENVRPSVIGLKTGGRGVELSGIRSVRDRFIDNQILDSKQYYGYYDTMSGVMLSVDALFDESTGLGLSDSMTNFFNAWNDVANHPTDIPTRNSLVTKSQSFASQMNNTYQRLIDQQEVMDSNIAVIVDEINSIANEIASLNEQVAYAEGSGNPANDLLDQRERRIRDLGEMVGVNVYYDQSNHSATIEVAGRPLVAGTSVNELMAVRNQYNSNYYDVYITQYGMPARDITPYVENGKLGALIVGRDGQTVNGSGTVANYTADSPAAGFATVQFSQDHNLSVGDLITINGETRSVVSILDSDEIIVNNFTAANAPAGGEGWEERDGYIHEYKNYLNKLATGMIYNVNSAHQAGYTLNGVTQTGQNFFEMNAPPGAVTSEILAGLNQVQFSTEVSSFLSVGDVISMNGQTRMITAYDPATQTATVDQAFGAAAGPGLAFEYAGVFTNATQIAVDSNIVSDSTLIAASSQPTQVAPFAVGNNDVASQIAQLMDSNNTVDTDNDGQVDYGTFHEYLHTLFTEVGNAGNTATYELDSNASMLNYLENKRDSISGVSLDEEAANLIQYEKSFQALGQFMGTISNLTDVLMQIV